MRKATNAIVLLTTRALLAIQTQAQGPEPESIDANNEAAALELAE